MSLVSTSVIVTLQNELEVLSHLVFYGRVCKELALIFKCIYFYFYGFLCNLPFAVAQLQTGQEGDIPADHSLWGI